MIGLYKTEVIRHEGPWKGLEEVEFATLEWVDWFNNVRLLEPIGYVPPAEFEESVLCSRSCHGRRGETQTREPPLNPGRFSHSLPCSPGRRDPDGRHCRHTPSMLLGIRRPARGSTEDTAKELSWRPRRIA